MLQDGSEKIPLTLDAGGELRITGTRVGLDSVVDLFEEGATPEEIVSEFDSLKLDDVYAVITYYLRHKQEVQSLLDAQDRKAAEDEREISSRFGHKNLRERVLKLRKDQSGAGI